MTIKKFRGIDFVKLSSTIPWSKDCDRYRGITKWNIKHIMKWWWIKIKNLNLPNILKEETYRII